MWPAGQASQVSGTIRFFAIIIVLDLLMIPWRYVFENYRKLEPFTRISSMVDSVRATGT